MTQRHSFFVGITGIALLLAAAATSPAAEFYVAPGANDSNPGTLEQPFATLEAARDAARAVAGKQPVTIYLRQGIHALSKTLQLGARDSGTKQSPVVWQAFRGEKPIVIGGRQIKGFQPYKNGIMKADVAGQGFKGVYFRQLIFDGRRQDLARWPNFDANNPYGGGWAYVDGKPVPMYADRPGEDKRTLVYKAQDAREWSRPEEAEVFIFPRYNWWNNIARVASIDKQSRTIRLAGDVSYAIRPGDRYYVRNAFEELDAPGEWYLDKQTWTLYFYPPAPLEGRAVYAPLLRTILQIDGAENIAWRGITFECAEGNAIEIRKSSECVIAACTIRNVGDYRGSGVNITDGKHNGVVGCDISFTGSNAIALSGGDRKTLTPAEHYADNNYIHHVGVFYKQGVGVALTGVGNRASHNLIHDGPRMGIMFSGNNLVIEYNHIRHVNLETADTGAVYTGGRDWISSRGSVVRYNYFHDIIGFGNENGHWVSPHFAWGVYLDDNTGGVDVIGNIVARCIRGLVHLHNGRDNLIENNILLEGTLQQVEYNGWLASGKSHWFDHLPSMIKGYESVAGQPAWKSMRNMDIHPTKAPLPNGMVMSGNVFRRNIVCWREAKPKLFKFGNLPLDHYESDYNLIWHFDQPLSLNVNAKTGAITTWEQWQSKGFDQHSLVADPLFEDLQKGDYRLKPDSPAYKLGFKPIPVEKIGPYADALRATWPIIEAEGAREKPLIPGQ